MADRRLARFWPDLKAERLGDSLRRSKITKRMAMTRLGSTIPARPATVRAHLPCYVPRAINPAVSIALALVVAEG